MLYYMRKAVSFNRMKLFFISVEKSLVICSIWGIFTFYFFLFFFIEHKNLSKLLINRITTAISLIKSDILYLLICRRYFLIQLKCKKYHLLLTYPLIELYLEEECISPGLYNVITIS